MARDKAVDEFVNCVIRRGDQDMILKSSLMIASLIAPLAFGILFSIAVLITHINDVFPEEEIDECLTVIILTAVMVEFAALSFMTFCISRRNWNHLKRDMIWMDSLCDFVDNNGGNANKMREIRSQARGRLLSLATKVSMVMWLVFIVMLIVEGILLHMSSPLLEESIIGVAAWIVVFILFGFVIELVQLILTVGAIFGMPARHDNFQSNFTVEFAKEARKFGFQVGPMEHTVKRRKIWIHILLMIVTLGLYSFVYFAIACRDMNNHIHVQWEYEEKLTQDLIEFVGGKGIEDTEDGRPNGLFRLINNLM